MNVYEVTLRNAAGRERTERVVATTANSASNQALMRVEKLLGHTDWMVVSALEVVY